MPLYFFPALFAFLIILLVFGILFFLLNTFHNPNLTIKSEAYYDSSKIILILSSPATVENQKVSIAKLISMAYEDEKYKTQLEDELDKILKKIPKPGIRQDYWNLDIKDMNGEFLHIGDKTIGVKDYSLQEVTLPLRNGDLVKISLYLNCAYCTEDDINDYG